MRIPDSEQNFKGSVDPMITVVAVSFTFWARILDFGFWLLGSSDCGSQHSPRNVTFSFLCAECQAVVKMPRNRSAPTHDGSMMADSD